MTPAELKSSRQLLGLSAKRFAELFGASDARAVRRWEDGTAKVPTPVAILIKVATQSGAARRIMGFTPPEQAVARALSETGE